MLQFVSSNKSRSLYDNQSQERCELDLLSSMESARRAPIDTSLEEAAPGLSLCGYR